jgi:glycosyltransferase involved in cell wall biosynthesis
MRIVIDARWIFEKLSGVGIYTRELIRTFARHDVGHELILLFDQPALLERTRTETGFGDNPRMRAELFPHGVFSPASQLRLGGRLRAWRADWYFSPNWMIPVLPGALRGVKVAVTLHDLIPLVLPGHAPNSLKSRFGFVYRALMRRIARRADVIFTVSEASLRDIATLLLPSGSLTKVVVAPNGVSSRIKTFPAWWRPLRWPCPGCHPRRACASSARPTRAIPRPVKPRSAWG